jgi:hypothetical protein
LPTGSIIGLSHALAKIEGSVPQSLQPRYDARSSLYVMTITPVASKSNAEISRVLLRSIIALLYLKHAFNESDEGLVARWAETPSWHIYSGGAYFVQQQPCDATTLV